MLYGIVGTTTFVLVIVVRWLNIICAHGILPSYWSLIKVTISLTFNVVVVLGWILDLSILTQYLWGHLSPNVVSAP